jgi:succinate dehydrogenase/fumarate reductase iron-sulfur protein
MDQNKHGAYSVKVYRTDPINPQHFWYDTFKVPYESGQSILGVLKYIYETYDPGLAFYHSCRIGKCTGCHVKVNGKARLACTTVADGKDLVIEPLSGYPIIRDLVIDRTKETISKRKNKGQVKDY